MPAQVTRLPDFVHLRVEGSVEDATVAGATAVASTMNANEKQRIALLGAHRVEIEIEQILETVELDACGSALRAHDAEERALSRTTRPPNELQP
jgi:hypothetical protein